MKTLIKSLALAVSLGVLTSAASFSEAKPIVRPTKGATYQTAVYTTIAGKLSVALDKQTDGAVTVNLKNADGKVLFSQYVGKKQRTYRTRLNLNELPDGVYQVEISNGVDITTHNLTLATQQPTMSNRLVALN